MKKSSLTRSNAPKNSELWFERMLTPESLLPKINIASKFTPSAIWQVSAIAVAKTSADNCKTFIHLQKRAAAEAKTNKKQDDNSANKGEQVESWMTHDEQGTPLAWLHIAENPSTPLSTFERHCYARESIELILKTHPSCINFVLMEPSAAKPEEQLKRETILNFLYVLLINTSVLPDWHEKPPTSCENINIIWVNEHGRALPMSEQKKRYKDIEDDVNVLKYTVEGQALCQALTLMPANILNPKRYRTFINDFAQAHDMNIETWDEKALIKKSAGAFLAVTQGQKPNHSAIVRLSLTANTTNTTKKQTKNCLLPIVVGKGVCFDTGGHQIKPAKYMLGMHRDMNGSAVALGIFYAGAKMGIVPMECYLAIADNAIGTNAYRPGDIVQAMDGTTIEVIHTDAEGRMVLADTLALIHEHHHKNKNVVVLDFATLTGSMIAATGSRMSGIFANTDCHQSLAINAGIDVGERVVAFPLPLDYLEGLKSTVADVLQCRIDGDADHIYAALFLSKFIKNIPWLHMDLSTTECTGGLGAIRQTINSFGIRWGIRLIEKLIIKTSEKK